VATAYRGSTGAMDGAITGSAAAGDVGTPLEVTEIRGKAAGEECVPSDIVAETVSDRTMDANQRPRRGHPASANTRSIATAANPSSSEIKVV